MLKQQIISHEAVDKKKPAATTGHSPLQAIMGSSGVI